MNIVEDSDRDRTRGWCEWPVQSPFYNQPARACGRTGYGTHLRLCWQHRDVAWGQLFHDLSERPDGQIAKYLGRWFASVEPSEYDDEERAAERAKSRHCATLAIRSAIEYGGVPDYLANALNPLVERLIEERMNERFGGAA